MNIPKEAQEKIIELQTIEQNIQNFALQKQKFQIGLNEVDNALSELKNLKDKEAYRIVGEIMIKSKKEDLEKDLNERKNILELRLNNIEKQENKINEKADYLKKEVMKIIENEKGTKRTK